MSVRGTPSQVGDDAATSPSRRATERRRRCRAEIDERARGDRPLPARRGSPRGRTPRTSAWSRSTPTPGCREVHALHRVRGLRPDDQPDGRRGPDLRRRGAGHRRRAARGLRLRRRRATRSPRTFMDYLLPTTTEVPDDRGRPHRDRVDHQPRRVQGHGRGRRDRLRTRPSPTRSPTRSPARRQGHEDAARPRGHLRAGRSGARRRTAWTASANWRPRPAHRWFATPVRRMSRCGSD